MSDWADEKAREWYRSIWPGADKESLDSDCATLAALLREQRAGYQNAEMATAEVEAMERDRVLAEVRRVVEDIRDHHMAEFLGRDDALNAVLSRLENM